MMLISNEKLKGIATDSQIDLFFFIVEIREISIFAFIMAFIQTTVYVRSKVAKKKIKELFEEKERRLEIAREEFSKIAPIIKRKHKLLKKKRTR
jgi:hypothetical protein